MSQIFYHRIVFQIKLRLLKFFEFNGFRWNFVLKSKTIDKLSCHNDIKMNIDKSVDTILGIDICNSYRFKYRYEMKYRY